MDEVKFIESIDACFPYEDEAKWKALVERGVALSDNAAYAILYEIFGAPPEVPQSDLLRILDYWSLRYDHPLKAKIVTAGLASMQGRTLPEDEVLLYLEALLPYPGLDSAAMILYHAAPEDSDRFREKYAELGMEWNRQRE